MGIESYRPIIEVFDAARERGDAPGERRHVPRRLGDELRTLIGRQGLGVGRLADELVGRVARLVAHRLEWRGPRFQHRLDEGGRRRPRAGRRLRLRRRRALRGVRHRSAGRAAVRSCNERNARQKGALESRRFFYTSSANIRRRASCVAIYTKAS